jgi:hypothetical protein
LQTAQIMRIKIEAFSLDSTSIKVHPGGTGAFKQTDREPSVSPAADGTPGFLWLLSINSHRINPLFMEGKGY